MGKSKTNIDFTDLASNFRNITKKNQKTQIIICQFSDYNLPNFTETFTYSFVQMNTNQVRFFPKIIRKHQEKDGLRRLRTFSVSVPTNLGPDLPDFLPSTLVCSSIYPFKRKSRLEKNKKQNFQSQNGWKPQRTWPILDPDGGWMVAGWWSIAVGERSRLHSWVMKAEWFSHAGLLSGRQVTRRQQRGRNEDEEGGKLKLGLG